ncbi:hypothetical protein [Arenimonas composti]|uniref:Branched-chain amino acid aminotransferase n=1 Tax=Arenimonas composti TR7-09 = DSM 18010 TaxID=1121013 RepID=A0A091C395_9GAMM|nr:hypothetical protein [Arenimonas composti]KFN51120.1 hypothetical protein P873_04265 [Arenimonas composti TR7-09 = DSM 18010]
MSAPAPRRIAMWSGPRNISTAMMRAWENRPDCGVSDEPLYAAYLLATGLDHPGRDEVIAAGDTDARRVVAALSTGPAPGGAPLWYQKHMSHHLLAEFDGDWVLALENVLLIRDPEEVVASYLRSRSTVAAGDIGLLQQARLFERLCDHLGAPPPVLDAGDFLQAPEAQLRGLCDRLALPFSARMLAWPPGPRASDGVWAPHWYATVWRSTGFEAPRSRRRSALGAEGRAAVEACRPAYERLREFRLVAP